MSSLLLFQFAKIIVPYPPMRYELEKFFSNPCEASGLLITEAPTGYGKTYETIQAIYRYIEKRWKISDSIYNKSS